MNELAAVLDAIRPGDRVFIPGSSGEPSAVLTAWREDPDRTKNLDIVTSLVPGINGLDLERLHPTARVTGLFMQPAFARAHREGRYRHLPLSYGGFDRAVRDTNRPFDVCVVQVAEPGVDGLCSMGPAAEFTPAISARSRLVLGLINQRTPAITSSPALAESSFTLSARVETQLPVYDTGAIDAASATIAGYVADFIPDGAALQVGLGKTPAALLSRLRDRRGLRLHSGMFGDGVQGLVDAGALDPDWDHRACVFVGSRELYAWAAGQSGLRVAGCETTHAPEVLAGLGRFHAVNSAIEVDLFGQAALEHAGGAAVSGAGGAPDFSRAASLSAGGVSILAMQATAARSTRSRIVDRLTAPGVVTLPRSDIDIVVTEHGAADLRGLGVHDRALALIAVADPKFRNDLADAWQAIAKTL
ncbi:acetyl-CoA hydrolase/transferase C-terminal domain-containing protein [soil metagenome]